MKKVLLLSAFLVLLLPILSLADDTINFTDPDSGDIIIGAGGVGTALLTTSSLKINGVSFDGGEVFDVNGGLLTMGGTLTSFNQVVNPHNGNPIEGDYVFSLDSLMIVGRVPGAHTGAHALLLDYTGSGDQIDVDCFKSGTYCTFDVAGGSNTLNSDLLDFFGVPGENGLSFALTLPNSNNDGSSDNHDCMVTSENCGGAGLTLHSGRGVYAGQGIELTDNVPEPATFSLLGFGLMSLLGLARRQR